jgi:hypothetical protein
MLEAFQCYVWSRVRVFLLVCVAATIVSGCFSSAPLRRGYAATIERVEPLSFLPSLYYSPQRGTKPRTCLYLRVSSASRRERGESLRVFLFDIYSPAIHGQRGDTVTFILAGAVPTSGDIEFDSLVAYRLAKRG